MRPLHTRTHPNLDVPGCFGCKAASVNFGCIDVTAQKKWDAELDYYADLRKQGIQPAGTTMDKCEQADELAQTYQYAWNAEQPLAHIEAQLED